MSASRAQRGLVVQRFHRVAPWRWLLLVVLLAVALEPFAWAWLQGHPLDVADWFSLWGQAGVVLVFGIVLSAVGLLSGLAGQALGDLRGARYLCALYANGFGVRVGLGERFIPWTAVEGVRWLVIETEQVTSTGAVTRGQPIDVYEIHCTGEPAVLIRQNEGGPTTASFVSERAGLVWEGNEARRA